MKNSEHKPVFVLFLNISGYTKSRALSFLKNMEEFLKPHTLSKDFHTIIIPISSETRVSIFYPEGTKNENYNELIKEITKLVATKNIRVNL